MSRSAYGHNDIKPTKVDAAPGFSFKTGLFSPQEVDRGASKKCGVLLHEVYAPEGLSKMPARAQAYHTSAHTSTYELAEIATKAQPKLLILYHQIYFGGASDDDLLREIRSRYHGRVVSAHDLDVY
jgi:ribonuclease BN (tRNA processing enzyme)